MARRFHGLRAQMVRSGRKTFWFSGVIDKTNLAAAGSAVLITSLNAAALALRPFTIVRTRGYWGMFADQLAASEDQSAHYGSIVVSDEAVAVGVSAVPTPVAQSSSSWIHFDGAAQRFEVITAVGAFPQWIPQRYVIDSKSMRKVEEGQDLIQVIEAGPNSAGATLFTFTKVLIKLH